MKPSTREEREVAYEVGLFHDITGSIITKASIEVTARGMRVAPLTNDPIDIISQVATADGEAALNLDAWPNLVNDCRKTNGAHDDDIIMTLIKCRDQVKMVKSSVLLEVRQMTIGNIWKLGDSSSTAFADQEQQALRRSVILPSLCAGIGRDPTHHLAAHTGPTIMLLILRRVKLDNGSEPVDAHRIMPSNVLNPKECVT